MSLNKYLMNGLVCHLVFLRPHVGALEAKHLAKPMVNKSILLSVILQTWIFKDQNVYFTFLFIRYKSTMWNLSRPPPLWLDAWVKTDAYEWKQFKKYVNLRKKIETHFLVDTALQTKYPRNQLPSNACKKTKHPSNS